jgi:hypothetical protein
LRYGTFNTVKFFLQIHFKLFLCICFKYKSNGLITYPTPFQYMMDQSDVFDYVFRLSNLCFKQVKFERNICPCKKGNFRQRIVKCCNYVNITRNTCKKMPKSVIKDLGSRFFFNLQRWQILMLKCSAKHHFSLNDISPTIFVFTSF